MEVETALINMSKSLEMLWGISERKKEALLLCFRMRQQASHGDDDDEQWIQVGDVMRPLSMEHSQKKEDESGEGHFVAIESAVLEIGLNTVGLITTGLITNG